MEFSQMPYGFVPNDQSRMIFHTTEAPRELLAVRATSHAPNSAESRLQVAGLTAVRSVAIEDVKDHFSWTTNAVYTVYRYVRPGQRLDTDGDRATLVIAVGGQRDPRLFHFDYIGVERALLALLTTCDAVTCFSLCTLYVQAIDAADSQGRHAGVRDTLQAHLEGRLRKSTRGGRTTVKIAPRPLRTYDLGDGTRAAHIDLASGTRPGARVVDATLQPHPFANEIEAATGVRPLNVTDTRFDAAQAPPIAGLAEELGVATAG